MEKIHDDVEGVIKFNLRHRKTSAFNSPLVHNINVWRTLFYDLAIIGQDPNRYHGLGFGNISHRIRRHAYLISGTQTGRIRQLDPRHYALITESDPNKNTIVSRGPVEPSSEAMTHGMIYALNQDVNAVIHTHSPSIWNSAQRWDIPITARSAAYGTPEMADEVKRLFDQRKFRKEKIFVMGGHEDGVISFGKTVLEAGTYMLRALKQSIS